ncbi:hypothetical protein [Cutibacterium modestum]|uniref:hypothetical protein n=1 Tax=Cutibacterium modestum TaxID=2559073 RepID=UPI000F056D62|nr:hypothetical protein [Cutibacterium modestum]
MPAVTLAPLGFATGLFDGDGCDACAELAPDFNGELTDSGSLFAHPVMAIKTVVTRATTPAIVFLRKTRAM